MAKTSQIKRAVFWSALDIFVRYGLSFIFLVFLARILSPSDFGLIAMLNFFIEIAKLLIESGFSQALIQRKNTTLLDESTIFFFTISMGAVVSLAICLFAPLIAGFYGQPLLQDMSYWMALNLFANSFATIHVALLRKSFNFKTITKAGGIASVASGSVAVLMAAWGFGVWSLVGQVLTMTIVSTIALWLFHPWRPQWIFCLKSLRSYFNFGGFLLLTGLLNTLHKNLYALLIGKLHPVHAVGFYSQARRVQHLPVTLMTSIIGRVAFSAFSDIADEKSKLAQGMKKALTAVMFVNAPVMLGLLIVAEPFILSLLGEKWRQSIPVLQVLTLAGLMWPFNSLNINILKAQGLSSLNARIQLIKLSVSISILMITSPYGILAVAYGQVVAAILGYFVNSYYSMKLLGYGAIAQFRDVSPYLFASLCMLGVVWVKSLLFSFPPFFDLISSVVVGAVVYYLICNLMKLEAVDAFMAIVRRNS